MPARLCNHAGMRWITLFLLFIAQALALPVESAELTLELLGQKPKGWLYVEVFQQPPARNWGAAPHSRHVFELHGNTAEQPLSVQLPPGRYALRAFLDVNNNGRLDRNESGVPVEPVGFSRVSRNAPKSASFRRALFDLNASGHVFLTLVAAKQGATSAGSGLAK